MGQQTYHIFKDAITQQNICLFLYHAALLQALASCLQLDTSVNTLTLLYTVLDCILTSYSFFEGSHFFWEQKYTFKREY